MPTNILVVGGAGFIGSHMSLMLHEAGFNPIVLDNLSRGHHDAVLHGDLVVADMSDRDALRQIFTRYSITAVMHFAAFIDVAESVQYPEKYYQNNVESSLVLLDEMGEHGVNKIIYSSTAAVYGEPQTPFISEEHPRLPINPYGKSKKIVEDILQDSGLQCAILRYFNAAGGDPEGRLSERHEPETHLIPLILEVARGKRDYINIYGDTYPTADGTCIRDYIHVVDICRAHLAALQLLLSGENNIICNLGNGQGYSVQQILTAARLVTGHTIPARIVAQRPGDPAMLVADATRARQLLNWTPQYPCIRTIIQHAEYSRYPEISCLSS